MSTPAWWANRRFGMSIDVSLASVPGWAPVGGDAAWYRTQLDPDAVEPFRLPAELPELWHHHRRRWAHIERFDDFFPFLHFEEFDPDEWAGVARDAGMGYAVMTARHRDGLCWWDAPGTDRTVLHDGPARNVLGQFSAAAERAGLVLGTSYSLVGTDAESPAQVRDLVDRYGSLMLWSDHAPVAPVEREALDAAVGLAHADHPDLVIDDGWSVDGARISTYRLGIPDVVGEGPWELRRPLGSSAGYNRAEPPEHLLSGRDVVALLTEVVAKAGHLTLEVGPDAAGRLPAAEVERLRAAGGWVRRHAALIERGRPWRTWGDEHCRYLDVDGRLHVIDVSGAGRFHALTPATGRVTSVVSIDGGHVDHVQGTDGVRLERPPRKAQRLPAVYVVDVDPPPPSPVELFPADARSSSTPTDLAPLLRDARPGTIVQLGDGSYRGPARVPDGVTVRGLGPGRTTVDGLESAAVVLGAGARLEHCRCTGGGTDAIAVDVVGDDAAMLGCEVVGRVAIRGRHDRVASTVAAGVLADGAERAEILRCTFDGNGVDTGIEIVGGAGHLIDSCELTGHRAAIVLRQTVGAAVRHCGVNARWYGVQLLDSEATDVSANKVERTMRAVDVDGGTDARIAGNAAADGDSGCVLRGGTSNAEVAGNYWERCRIGLLAWDAGEFRAHGNTCTDLGEPDGELVVGP